MLRGMRMHVNDAAHEATTSMSHNTNLQFAIPSHPIPSHPMSCHTQACACTHASSCHVTHRSVNISSTAPNWEPMKRHVTCQAHGHTHTYAYTYTYITYTSQAHAHAHTHTCSHKRNTRGHGTANGVTYRKHAKHVYNTTYDMRQDTWHGVTRDMTRDMTIHFISCTSHHPCTCYTTTLYHVMILHSPSLPPFPLSPFPSSPLSLCYTD